MGLTNATGPFSKSPAGEFNVEIAPATGSVLFWDPVPQRIRAVFAVEIEVDGAALEGPRTHWSR